VHNLSTFALTTAAFVSYTGQTRFMAVSQATTVRQTSIHAFDTSAPTRISPPLLCIAPPGKLRKTLVGTPDCMRASRPNYRSRVRPRRRQVRDGHGLKRPIHDRRGRRRPHPHDGPPQCNPRGSAQRMTTRRHGRRALLCKPCTIRSDVGHLRGGAAWMAGTSPAMTANAQEHLHRLTNS
jgi:hypothetical protein